jgi:hypothetical protein
MLYIACLKDRVSLGARCVTASACPQYEGVRGLTGRSSNAAILGERENMGWEVTWG